MSKRVAIPIDQNWEFRQADKKNSKYLPVARFPTNVHLDLLHHGQISDPFAGKNENDCQWVGEAVWVYRTAFDSPALTEKEWDTARAVLAFHGLDTYATVTLNGKEILKTESMFVPERVDVTADLVKERANTLEITFDSAYLKGWELIEKNANHQWGCWNGDNSRLAVRKAQYHWGWDWGPTLMTCGPWRPICLEIYESRVADLYFTSSVDESLAVAELIVKADTEGSATHVKFDVSLDGKEISTETVRVNDNHATTVFTMKDPELWYPVRYGRQPLYTLTATLLRHGALTEADVASKKFGLRRAELVQRHVKDRPGSSFFFRINNIPVFCGGSNWIPADNFIPRISAEKYRDWVQMVADGNQVMIRVWGGGIFEEQALYDACDELGVLVWQDFMFGCGNYPAFPEYLQLVQREAEENVKILRHHPCIVIWAGNNEDYQYQESQNLTYDSGNQDEESWLKTDFPARYIYEKILADCCKSLIPDVPYRFGSPWGGKNTCDPTVGDIHQWNVWHGTQEKYQNFDKLGGRFVSEFGMQAFPSIKTIDSFLPNGKDDAERYAQSSTTEFHNKADGHERRIALYLAENMRYAPAPIEQFVYCTQLMQAECLASAYRLWKREWKGVGREYCGGALVWQINDCWPAISWSIVDYYLRPKLAYYVVKREMAAISCGISRKEHSTARNKHTRAYMTKTHRVEIWGSNLTLRDMTVDVVVKAWDVITGAETFRRTTNRGVRLPKNQSTEITTLEVPVRQKDAGEESRTVVGGYIMENGRQVARYINWPEPLKYAQLQKPAVLTAEVGGDGRFVDVAADVPVKGLALDCDDDGVAFDDNCVDVVPGETVRVAVRGATAATVVSTRYLGMV